MSADPWCVNCRDRHSVEESCSDNAKRYGDVDWCGQARDLQQRIDRVLALCGDADTGWPAMVAKILRPVE